MKYKNDKGTKPRRLPRLRYCNNGKRSPDTDRQFMRTLNNNSIVIIAINMKYYRVISGGGSIHDGSLRAEKMLNDVSNAALEPFLIKELVTIFASRQHL